MRQAKYFPLNECDNCQMLLPEGRKNGEIVFYCDMDPMSMQPNECPKVWLCNTCDNDQCDACCDGSLYKSALKHIGIDDKLHRMNILPPERNGDYKGFKWICSECGFEIYPPLFSIKHNKREIRLFFAWLMSGIREDDPWLDD